jgi:hypothetical protein
LVKKLVPEVDREVAVGRGETGDEVVFESPDGSLCGVAAVDARWSELEIDVGAGDELFQDVAGFVVKALELWSEASGDKKRVHHLEGT